MTQIKGTLSYHITTILQYHERGETLIDFCQENNLAILNTLFKQHPRRLVTWISPNHRYRNQIDYILVYKRWRSSFKAAKTYPGADCDSDHQLLVATMKMRLRKIKRQKKPVRYDISKISDNYRVKVKNQFQCLLDHDHQETSPEELWQEIKKVVLEAAEETVPKRKSRKRLKERDWKRRMQEESTGILLGKSSNKSERINLISWTKSVLRSKGMEW